MSYTHDLACKGGHIVSSILETDILDNEEGTLANCSMVNVRLPLAGGDSVRVEQISAWIMKTMILDYQTAVFVTFYDGSWWVRLSAQVYLTLVDFERAGRLLKEACDRASHGEWNAVGES